MAPGSLSARRSQRPQVLCLGDACTSSRGSSDRRRRQHVIVSVNPQRLHPAQRPEPGFAPCELDELLTAEEVAALLHVPRSTVSNYARRGVLPSIKLGRHRRFVRSDVVYAIERLRQQSRPPI